MKIAVILLLSCALVWPLQKAEAQTGAKPRAAALNHLALYTADLQRATNFYLNLFNLELDAEPFHDGKHTWFKLGNGVDLHIIQGTGSTAVYQKSEHLCFSVPSISAFIKQLQTQNIKFESFAGQVGEPSLRPDGVKQIYLQDPDGHWLEVNDAK